MEGKSGGKIKEYMKELDLYEDNKTLTMQLHNATMQLHSANAQHHQLLQEKERLTKENNELKQKVKELTDQLGKNVGSTLTQIETLKKQNETYRKQIETCQQQLTKEKEDHKHDLRNFWKLYRVSNGMKAIMNEKRAKMKENRWINTNEVIEMIDKMKEVIRNETQ